MSDFPLVAHPDDMRSAWINDLFAETTPEVPEQDIKTRAEAFVSLTEHFLSFQQESKYQFDDLQFDAHGVRAMLGRFQRDAFGLKRLHEAMDHLVAKNKLDGEVAVVVRAKVDEVGIRIGSDDPKKTRIAAAFSLWMCVFRPVCLNYKNSSEDPNAVKFCAGLTFWIAKTYLSQFGDVLVDARFNEHFSRVLHDFTYRAINLSTLEMLYCSIFRERKKKPVKRKK